MIQIPFSVVLFYLYLLLCLFGKGGKVTHVQRQKRKGQHKGAKNGGSPTAAKNDRVVKGTFVNDIFYLLGFSHKKVEKLYMYIKQITYWNVFQ
jgi:hypothetical protein